MSRPFKHLKTGIYWLRRRVPQDLIAAIGRREITKSLETRDPAEAKIRLVQRLAELDTQWANLRQASRQITDREAHALAREVHDAWLAEHRENPTEQHLWHSHLHPRLWSGTYVDPEDPTARMFDENGKAREDQPFVINVDDHLLQLMHRYCRHEAERLLRKHGFSVHLMSIAKTSLAVGEAMQRATLILDQEAKGIYAPGTGPFGQEPPPVSVSAPGARAKAPLTLEGAQLPSPGAPGVSLMRLVEAWWREAQATGRKPSTRESYTNTFTNLVRFLEHDDAGRVTVDDIIRFKDHRLTTPSTKTGRVASAKTVKGSDLTALKTVFGWAVANRRLPDNPAALVTMKVGKKARLRPEGFTDEEASAILKAALAYRSSRERPGTAAAKRWVPWLCAYTGARVGEMAQLRKQDIRQWGEHWVVRITPEAGTTKTNEAREVVLHP